MLMLERLRPNWCDLVIHESSPSLRGTSVVLGTQCGRYVPTQYFRGIERGSVSQGVRCEDLENQTFPDETFDVVITQDVMEHVFNPARAYAEICRTLRPGGLYLHTTPIYAELAQTVRKAKMSEDGTIQHLDTPEYHGNPIDDSGSLVTFHFGRDLPKLIASWAEFSVEVTGFNDRRHGIVAEFMDVIVCTKTAA